MSVGIHEADEGLDKPVVFDKYNLGAADLEKITDYNDDKDDIQPNNALNNVDHLKAATAKVISLRAEDVKLLIDEFELTRGAAERYLIKHRGDIKSTVCELIGFE